MCRAGDVTVCCLFVMREHYERIRCAVGISARSSRQQGRAFPYRSSPLLRLPTNNLEPTIAVGGWFHYSSARPHSGAFLRA